MASGTMKWYRAGLVSFLSGSIDFPNDKIKVMLTTSSYTASQDGHDFKNDVTNEVSGTGYTAGGYTLGTKSVGTSAGCIARLIAGDAAWSTSYITNARNAVVYASTNATGTLCPLIGYCTFGADTSSSNGTFTLDFDGTNGLLYIDGA